MTVLSKSGLTSITPQWITNKMLLLLKSSKTASEAALLVITSSYPIGLLAGRQESRELGLIDGWHTTGELRRRTFIYWKVASDVMDWNRWTLDWETHSGFGGLGLWWGQMSTWHSCYRNMATSGNTFIGRGNVTHCIYGDVDQDDAEHTFFESIRWELGTIMMAPNLTSVMLRSE